MENHNIKADKITKPIQLLAVWLIGLIILVSALITASATVKQPDWLPAFYSISAVSIIPLFLILIFLLQTRFRPEMQEDEYYSKFLNDNTKKVEFNAPNIIVENVEKRIDEKLATLSIITKEQINTINTSISQLSKDSSSHNDLVVTNSTKLDNFIRETTTKIQLNNRLKNFREIVSFLTKNNIRIDELFGEDSLPVEVFLISFGVGVDLSTLKLIINGLRRFEAQYIRTVSQENGRNSIYIGSYAYKGVFDNADQTEVFAIALLDDIIIDEINESKTINEAYSIVLGHMDQWL